jgi:hypothetical protein
MTATDRSAIQEIIQKVFEEARCSKGAPFEPDRLAAFLTSPAPATGKRASDTLTGRRRLCRFIESLQLELGICFTKEEWERGFGLSDLVDLADTKLRNPAQAERLALKRKREARVSLVAEPIRFGLVIGAVAALPAALGNPLVRILAAVLWVAAVVATISLNARQYRYAQKLAARTSSRAA